MSDDIFEDLRKIFEIKQDIIIEFKEVYGFTFVFSTRIHTLKDGTSSGEIKPLGIIYNENGEYYFAPLDRVENIPEIIKEYVKIILEGECSRFQQ